MRWQFVVMVAASIAFGPLASPAEATRDNADGGGLSAMDYIEIQQLYAWYSIALDSGDGAARAATFTPDGTFATYLSKHKLEPAAELAKRTDETGNRGHRHLMINIIIKPAPQGATGFAYALLLDSKHVAKTGFYNDTLEHMPDGWRFKTRELWLDEETDSPYRARTQDSGLHPQ